MVAIGAVERYLAGARHAAERKHLLAIITASQVSPSAAAVAAAPRVARPPVEPRPYPAS